MAGIKRNYDGIEKRKHVALTILQKVEIIRRMDAGSSVKFLAGCYGISPRTVYDIKKNREKILQFYLESDSNAGIAGRKTIHTSKSENLDEVLYEWFKQRRSEGVPITGPLLQEKAKEIHKKMNIPNACSFSSGWLTRFKQRHGIRYLKACGEKLSANHEAAEEFIDSFSELVKEENLSPEQIYNVDETGLFWRCLPRQTFATADEIGPSGFKEAKERITAVVCSNAAGTHKCKLMIVSKSAHPRALKGVKVLPVIYRNNKKAWITQDIFREWFENHFVKEARAHCSKIGMPTNCKILLLLDNCPAHPKLLQKDNVSTLLLPPNTTSIFQPMDQGIICSIKCYYKMKFVQRMLSVDSSVDVEGYKKDFNIKDCIFLLAESWNTVSKDALVHAWHNLWPASLFIESENEDNDFNGFSIDHVKEKAEELLTFAKNALNVVPDFLNEKNELVKWMSSQDEAAVTETFTDDDIINSVTNTNSAENRSVTDSDTDSDDEGERVTLEQGLALGCKYLDFLQKQNFVTEQEIMTVHRLQEKILKQKSKVLKQITIDSMFKNHYIKQK